MISHKTVTLVCVFISLLCPYSLATVLSYKHQQETVKEYNLEDDTVKEFVQEKDTVKEFSQEGDTINTDQEVEAINAKDARPYKDCGAVRKYGGYTESGVYKISTGSEHFKIYCIHEMNNSYNVIQRRMYGNVNFYRGWHDYQYGFGNAQQDFWAGLNQIYYFTSTGNNVLTVNLQDWAGNNRNARYNHFKLTNNVYFTLNIGLYQSTPGDAGDSMSHNNGMNFATFDHPDYHNCAMNQHAGWWFNYCTYANLNGVYYHKGPYTPTTGFYDGTYWFTWGGYGYSMKYAQMMLSSS